MKAEDGADRGEAVKWSENLRCTRVLECLVETAIATSVTEPAV